MDAIAHALDAFADGVEAGAHVAEAAAHVVGAATHVVDAAVDVVEAVVDTVVDAVSDVPPSIDSTTSNCAVVLEEYSVADGSGADQVQLDEYTNTPCVVQEIVEVVYVEVPSSGPDIVM
ncbi:hypothetical protein TRAPUB_4466 [Trametes pubescens]|uniref:Uncharacterized protein n=1 Tax=Trametes pubescens TaxID=154538 RepID=A0A1M2VAR1_TRAPU|nr:hypothetical protein TRAPUB_4466 [Trametes pubescens]